MLQILEILYKHIHILQARAEQMAALPEPIHAGSVQDPQCRSVSWLRKRMPQSPREMQIEKMSKKMVKKNIKNTCNFPNGHI